MRDLDTPIPHGLGHDAQFVEDDQVLSVGEVNGVDVETWGCGSLRGNPVYGKGVWPLCEKICEWERGVAFM